MRLFIGFLIGCLIGIILLAIQASHNEERFDKDCVNKGGHPYYGRNGYLCLKKDVVL